MQYSERLFWNEKTIDYGNREDYSYGIINLRSKGIITSVVIPFLFLSYQEVDYGHFIFEKP